MGHLSVILALTDTGCAIAPTVSGEIVGIKARPKAVKRPPKNATTTATKPLRKKAVAPSKPRRAATERRKRRGAKRRRSQLLRSLKSFQDQSPVKLGRVARTPLPNARLKLWHQLLDACGRWASLAHSSKDAKLATRLALWLEDQLALEGRRYQLPAPLKLRITEQIRFSKSRTGKAQAVVITIRHFSPRWPVKDIVVSSFFGHRKDPITGKKKRHQGVDFAVPIGTAIKAVADGTVTQSERRGTLGELVVIRHRGGWESRYAHLKIRQVKQGQKVRAGQLIAKSGNSGRSTGPHLHLELRKSGKAIDPLSLSGWH